MTTNYDEELLTIRSAAYDDADDDMGDDEDDADMGDDDAELDEIDSSFAGFFGEDDE